MPLTLSLSPVNGGEGTRLSPCANRRRIKSERCRCSPSPRLRGEGRGGGLTANVFEASEGGTLRRIVAAAGATLPIGALLAVAAPASVPDTEIDAFVAGFAPPEPAAEAAAEDTGPAPHDIDAGGRRLRVLELGGGDAIPVVFLHGFGADLNTWMFNQPALADSRRAVALDLPGHGGSVKEIGAGDAETLAGSVIDALSALGIDQAHLVGHSMASTALSAPSAAATRRRCWRCWCTTPLSSAARWSRMYCATSGSTAFRPPLKRSPAPGSRTAVRPSRSTSPRWRCRCS